MDSQTADFFAERPDTTQKRGPVSYYQAQDDRVPTPTAAPPFAAQSTATNTSQQSTPFNAPPIAMNATHPAATFTAPAMATKDAQAGSTMASFLMGPRQILLPAPQNAATGQANVAPAHPTPALPSQVQINGPILWHYQDNNAQPEPLVRDENMMDMDMPDAGTTGVLSERKRSQLTVCTCTRIPRPSGSSGLNRSLWSAENLKIDDNCPYHGSRATSSYRRNDNGNPRKDYGGGKGYGGGNGSGGGNAYDYGPAPAASENAPRYNGFYQ